MADTLTRGAPLIQGINAPNVAVNPAAFYAATRRLKFPMKSNADWSGIGTNDSVELRQTGIVAALEVRVKGTLTFGGTIGTTTVSHEWPFNLVQEFRLSANGQSNLVAARGLTVRAHEFATNPKIVDNGRANLFGGSSVEDGLLKLGSDDWGTGATDNLGPGSNVTTAEAKTFDITYVIPVAADPKALIGAVYAQSSATNLTLDIQWATQAQILEALGGAATIAYDVEYDVTGVVYTIPNVGGQYVVPDLSQFHQISEFRRGGLSAGENEILLPGTGVGRKLLRVLWNVYSGSTEDPLALNDTNYSTVAWRYGGNDTPEVYASGGKLAAYNERVTGVVLGKRWGLGLWDFANEFALRDVVDEGYTSDLRIVLGLVASPTSGFAQVAQETLFAAPVGA